MNPAIVSTAKRLSERQLRAFEKRHGLRVPAQYRRFLLAHNGGAPEARTFRLRRAPKGIPPVGAIKSFLGIGVPAESLGLDYVLATFGARLPANLFPIARDPGGSLICIGAAGADKGRVFFWDHEFEAEDGQPPTKRNIYLIAESFSEFLSELTP